MKLRFKNRANNGNLAVFQEENKTQRFDHFPTVFCNHKVREIKYSKIGRWILFIFLRKNGIDVNKTKL